MKLLWIVMLVQLWITYPRTGTILSGNWQSCSEGGEYAERIYEYRVLGKYKWELHMGPKDEFGLYTTPQPDDHSHDSAENLLVKYKYDDIKSRSGRTWHKLGVWINVTQSGGSRPECESYFIKVEKDAK